MLAKKFFIMFLKGFLKIRLELWLLMLYSISMRLIILYIWKMGKSFNKELMSN